MEIKTDALMLKSIDYKENDQILTLFSLEKGKISASARGVKKAGAKLKFAAQPFCFAEYILYEKGGRNTLTSASLIDSFYDLRTDLVKFYSAFSITQFCDIILYEDSASPQLFIAAVNALKELCYQKDSGRNVLIKFFIEALSVVGYKMNFEKCGICQGKIEEEIYFDFEDGSIICGKCKTGKRVSGNTYRVITEIINGTYDLTKTDKDGEVRALKLLYAFIFEKTGAEPKAVLDLLAL